MRLPLLTTLAAALSLAALPGTAPAAAPAPATATTPLVAPAPGKREGKKSKPGAKAGRAKPAAKQASGKASSRTSSKTSGRTSSKSARKAAGKATAASARAKAGAARTAAKARTKGGEREPAVAEVAATRPEPRAEERVASRLPSRASERRPAVAARAEPGRRKRPFERYAESARRLRARVMQSIADAPSVSLAGAGSLTETAPTLALARTKGDSIVALARAQIGTRYILGARAPGRAFDCSGFVQYLMAALNVSLPRTAHTQYYAGKPMRVDVTQLKPGDLLAFGSPRRVSHIAVYTGNGSFVHASSRAGQVVETPLRLERTGDGFFLFGAVRVLAQNDSGGSFTVADSLLDLRGLNFAPWP